MPATTPPSLTARLCWRGQNAGLLVLVVLLAGCDQAETKRSATVDPPPTPEERFESIVKTLRRQLESDDLSVGVAGGDYNAEPGVPVTNATVRVTQELIPPAAEGQPYRGVICLRTKSKVTVVLPQPTEEEAEKDKAKRKAQRDELESELEGVADLDMLVAPKADRFSSSPIHEIEPDETESCYDLEYREGRWVLLSELDEENEPFYAIAIEYAMKRQ